MNGSYESGSQGQALGCRWKFPSLQHIDDTENHGLDEINGMHTNRKDFQAALEGNMATPQRLNIRVTLHACSVAQSCPTLCNTNGL